MMGRRQGNRPETTTVKRLAAPLLALCLATPVSAQDANAGRKTVWDATELLLGETAYAKGDYSKAARYFRIAAGRKNAWSADAESDLGLMYDRGQGVPQDYTEAVKWYRRAAAQGNAGAQFSLGFMYDKGHGVVQNYAEAQKWYRLAAAHGLVQAQAFLGLMYDKGHGVPQDYAEALKWYRLAAAQGHAGALLNIGFMYDKGHGVVQDYVQAHKWFNLAAALTTDKDIRDMAAKDRDSVARLMTPADVSKAQRLAREWLAAFRKRQKK